MLTTKDAQAVRLELMAREYVQRIGARMRERREELGLSQREVADQMPGAVTGNDISRWERGEHKPGDERLEKLAEILQTSVAYFLTDKRESATPDLSNAPSQLDRIEAAQESLTVEVAAIRVELATALTLLEELTRSLAQKRGSGASESRTRKAK